MTSDLAQNQYTNAHISKSARKSARAAGRAPALPAMPRTLPPAPVMPLEITRDADFVAGRHDIFDVLARHETEKQGWERSMGATLALLERARAMLGGAEKVIREQEVHLRELEDASGLCALTGLLNRQGFTKAFVREVARTQRGLNEGGLLVIFNLENLSRIEELHGREAGHAALKLVARALESEIRDMDCAARVQPDEFVLLFAETSMEKALGRLQHMALRLNKLSLPWQGQDISLSLSLGLKSYRDGERAEQIFKSASEDLLRNRRESSRLKPA
jgi:diguanylate cyclase